MRTLLPALSLLLISSCNRNTVNLENTNAKGEVPQLGNLTFRFSHALAHDSALNQWDSTAYVSFKPAIRGRFRWEQPDQLVFSPSQPLPPSTDFTAELSDKILQDSKYNHIGNDDKLEFFTPELRLEDLHVSWMLQNAQSNVATPRLDLYFNYPVSPNDIKDKLKLEIEGKVVPFNVYTLSDDRRISVLLQGIRPQDKDLETKVTIGKGIVPKGGTTATKDHLVSSCVVPSPFNLIINDISSGHDGLSGTVNISTSQQVSANDIPSLIKIDPSVKFTVEATDDGFALRSEKFNADKTYLLTIHKGLRGKIGGVLQEQYDRNIAFGELEPSLHFATNKSVYLSGQGNRMIEMKIVNVPAVKVIISKIYESNLLNAQHYGYDPKETMTGNEDQEEYNDDYNQSITMGDIIYEKEIDTRTLPKIGNSRLFTFDIEDRLPDSKGIYHIKVRSAKNYWLSDSRFISVSDLGLIAKEGRNKLFVFTTSIKTAEPIAGVNIVAYGKNNQVLGAGATNEEGVAEIGYTRREFAGFKPAMIIAKTEKDFNYLPFNSSKVNTSRFEIGGKRISNTSLDAFIYPERDIYRPGERVNFSVIVRDLNWKVPGELPLKFKFLLPNGKELKTFRKSLNEQGSLEGQVDISPAAITGSYTLEVYTSFDVLIGSRNFSIEEFIPDRIKVTASLDKPFLQPGEKAKLSVNAVNFFGPPAAGRNYEVEIQLKAKNFQSKKYSNYDFSIQNQGISLDKVLKEGKLDEKGDGIELYEVPAMFSNNGILKADFYTTVFDETGRPVSKVVTSDVFTQPVFFGVADDGFWYYPLNQAVKFPVIALDKDEKLLSGAKAVIKMIKHEYRTILSKSGSYFRYESQEDDKLLSEQNVTVNGKATSYSFVPRSAGNYEIRISSPGATGYVSRKFYSYGSWGGDNNSFEVNTEGNIDIETDKSTYKAGDNAKILFKSPFDGKMLVTVETDKVISYQYVNVEKRTSSIDIKISSEHLPNVFVTATLIKPHTISDIPLTVAHGFQNIKVEDESRKNRIEIIALKSARSKTKQQVTIKADPGSYITFAAVDNGVLQVSDFKTPDPYAWFYSPRALQVDAYDLYPFLFPEVRGRLSSTGGDGETDMRKRVNPMPSKRVQLVSYWSGIVKTNGGGQAKISFDVPKFSGQIRLMAVAYKDNSFGSAESVLTIADPVVISTGLPRFLSPGDTVSVPVTLTNTTNKNTEAVATIRGSGPLKIIGNNQQNISLAANSEGKALFTILASQSIDTGSVYIDVQAGGEKYSDETAVGIRPSSPLQIITSSGSVTGGKTKKLILAAADFLPGTVRQKMVVSRSPMLESADQLRYLVQYPYGCTEQVVSAAFPQLYYGDLSRLLIARNGNDNPNKNILEAIRKIKLRQLFSGAVTLWDNEGTESWWTTIYAAHFLLEARKAGFDVEDGLLNSMLNYLNGRLRNKNIILYYYNRDRKKKIAPKEVAYSLYVLSLASRPNVSAMNYYKANPQVMSLDSKYLLSVAYAIAGDKKKFSELLPGSFSGEESVPETGGSFYSPIRDEAISLNALIDVDPGNAQIPLMARHVADQLKTRNWYTTQECAFSFLALGKLARSAGKSTVTADIKQNGKVVSKFIGKEVSIKSKNAVGNFEITTKGEGRLYYYMQTEGISASGQYKPEDSYIKIRRRFFDRYGRKTENNFFSRNDLVIVQLSLEKSYGTPIENIVITDLLPAGFEIENPRTKEIPGMEWIKDVSSPTEIDVRDDRINLFVNMTGNRQVYYYAARAVRPGNYKLGPVAAEAMYNGEYHSYNGAGMVRVKE